MAKTKIVATLGPACDNHDTLKAMIKAGVSTVRINTAHIENGYITQAHRLITNINHELNTHVGVMVDLKGPELRTGNFKNDMLKIKQGQEYLIGTGAEHSISINFPDILPDLSPGTVILMSDGKLKFQVIENLTTYVKTRALSDGTLRSKSRVNIPGKILNLGTITDRDKIFLKESIQNDIEFFALSFVQSKEDVEYLQELIMENGSNAFVVSKIETKNGYHNIEKIAKVSDLIMVARGDLGVELPLEEVSVAQKKIIITAHKYSVPTIVATQVLESMVSSNIPTRAEVSDVTNAILDNTDAIMLSEETAIGAYPIEGVKYIEAIARYVEAQKFTFEEPLEFLGNKIAFSIAKAAKVIAHDTNAVGIIAFTKSGNTVKMLSALRPSMPIYAAVTSSSLARKLNIFRDVYPILMPKTYHDLLLAVQYLSSLPQFKIGARLVITSGMPYLLFGGTNDVRTVTVGRFLGRGYPLGTTVKGKVTKVPGNTADILLVEDENPKFLQGYEKYKAIIFTHKISHKLEEKLHTHNVSVLASTNLIYPLQEGQTIFIDAGSGVIIF